MTKIVRFKGKFTDLIPAGWTFQKLFARNYRQYHKTCDGEEYSQGCRIWQHHGGYLEIADLFSDSWIIVQKIIDGTINELASQTRSPWSPEKTKTVYWLRFDMQDKVFHPYHSAEHNRLLKMSWSFADMTDKEERKEVARAFYDRYREFQLRPETIVMIQEMVDKNWLEIVEIPDEA